MLQPTHVQYSQCVSCQCMFYSRQLQFSQAPTRTTGKPEKYQLGLNPWCQRDYQTLDPVIAWKSCRVQQELHAVVYLLNFSHVRFKLSRDRDALSPVTRVTRLPF